MPSRRRPRASPPYRHDCRPGPQTEKVTTRRRFSFQRINYRNFLPLARVSTALRYPTRFFIRHRRRIVLPRLPRRSVPALLL